MPTIGDNKVSHRILIVDDNPKLRDLVRDILLEERAGDRIVTASSASDALAVVHHEPADVLITDWQMPPGMDGLTLIETVQFLHPETQAILMTTADQDEVHERSFKRPASFTFFAKPFSIEAFLAHIDQLLTQRDIAAEMPLDAVQGDGDEGSHRSKPGLRPALSWG